KATTASASPRATTQYPPVFSSWISLTTREIFAYITRRSPLLHISQHVIKAPRVHVPWIVDRRSGFMTVVGTAWVHVIAPPISGVGSCSGGKLPFSLSR